MQSARVYFDHNATTPVIPLARDAMLEALECFGNPSSIHAEGRVARSILDRARRDVGSLVGAAPDDVVFTSGGTEALNMVLTPDLTFGEGSADALLIAAGEHAAVFEGQRFQPCQVERVATTANGTVDLAALDEGLRRHPGRRVMLALQAANNETGVIQPVVEASAMVHARGGFVVCDAVQAPGKMDCRLAAFGADAIAVSAHKFGGPKGVGALIFGPTRSHLKRELIRGGGQERGLRSGTENLVGIAGFGAAARAVRENWRDSAAQQRRWSAAIEEIVASHVSDAVFFGRGIDRLPNTVSFAAPGFDAQTLLMGLDLAGVAVSAGSACSSGKVRPSHVLRGMGVAPELIKATLRISLGWTTRDEDVAAFEIAFAKAVRSMRPRTARAAA